MEHFEAKSDIEVQFDIGADEFHNNLDKSTLPVKLRSYLNNMTTADTKVKHFILKVSRTHL